MSSLSLSFPILQSPPARSPPQRNKIICCSLFSYFVKIRQQKKEFSLSPSSQDRPSHFRSRSTMSSLSCVERALSVSSILRVCIASSFASVWDTPCPCILNPVCVHGILISFCARRSNSFLFCFKKGCSLSALYVIRNAISSCEPLLFLGCCLSGKPCEEAPSLGDKPESWKQHNKNMCARKQDASSQLSAKSGSSAWSITKQNFLSTSHTSD